MMHSDMGSKNSSGSFADQIEEAPSSHSSLKNDSFIDEAQRTEERIQRGRMDKQIADYIVQVSAHRAPEVCPIQ